MNKALFLLWALLVSCNYQTEPTEKAKADTVNINLGTGSIKAALKDEPKILDYVVTEASVLYVSVADDGTNRNGYASYLCDLAKENNDNSINRVKIIKANSQNDPNKDNAYGIELGECWCK
jgi:hypothetical protein